MLNNMNTRIFKMADLSWDAMVKIKRWFRPDVVRETLTLDSLSNNPSLKVAEVTNSVGQTVSFCVIEPTFVVSPIVNPKATVIETGKAGDFADRALTSMAQHEGMTRFLIVCPPDYPSQPDERWVRIIERKVPNISAMQCADRTPQPHTALSN
jgi:hypothetical protein